MLIKTTQKLYQRNTMVLPWNGMVSIHINWMKKKRHKRNSGTRSFICFTSKLCSFGRPNDNQLISINLLSTKYRYCLILSRFEFRIPTHSCQWPKHQPTLINHATSQYRMVHMKYLRVKWWPKHRIVLSFPSLFSINSM